MVLKKIIEIKLKVNENQRDISFILYSRKQRMHAPTSGSPDSVPLASELVSFRASRQNIRKCFGAGIRCPPPFIVIPLFLQNALVLEI